MIEPYPGRYRPLRFTLWSEGEAPIVEFKAGDVLAAPVENFYDKAKKAWGWRFTILRPVEEEKGG